MNPYELYERFMNVRRFPPGRIKVALRSVHNNIGAPEDPVLERATSDAILDRCDEGFDAVNRFVELRNLRAAQRAARNDGQAAAADGWLDELLVAIYTNVGLMARQGRKRPSEAGDLAQRLLDTLLRRPLGELINLPYEEQLVEAEHIWRVLNQEHRGSLAALNIELPMAALPEALSTFRLALEPEERVTTQMVREAADAMYRSLVDVIAIVLGRLPGPDNAEVRQYLLAGVVEQDERLREALAARRRAGGGGSVDVDGDGVLDDVGDVGDDGGSADDEAVMADDGDLMAAVDDEAGEGDEEAGGPADGAGVGGDAGSGDGLAGAVAPPPLPRL